MSSAFIVYLHDHLAGARFAIEVLQDLAKLPPENAAGRVAAKLLPEIEDDRQILEQLAARSGDAGSTLKEAAAWVAQKASRLKLRLGNDPDFGTFEAVEILTLGVLGKSALWRAIERLPAGDSRRANLDLSALNRRALAQFDLLDEVRLELASSLFAANN
jgi:hypothetical protein